MTSWILAAALPLSSGDAIGWARIQSPSAKPPATEFIRANGLATTTFNLPEGKITVYLPDDLAAGDTISGTVVAEPAGATPAQRSANQDVLNGFVVDVNEPPKQSRQNRHTWSLHRLAQWIGATVVLRNPSGRTVAAPPIRVEPPSLVPPANYSLPKAAVLGRPIPIRGPFDGDMANTACQVGSQRNQPLAESPRGAVFPPVTALGEQPLELTEGGKSQSGRCQFVTFNLSIGDAVIRTGQSTNATIRVGGLGGRKDPLTCFLFNHDPSIVRLQGGDVVPLEIRPTDVGSDGSYRKEVRVTATGVGVYRLSLQFPGQSEVSPQLAVTPPEPQPEDRERIVEPFGIELQEPKDKPIQVTLWIVPANKRNPIVEARAAIRVEPNGSWRPLALDRQGDRLRTVWDRSASSGGLYTVRVEAVSGDQQVAQDQVTLSVPDPESGRPPRTQFGNRAFQTAYTRILATMPSHSPVADGHRRRAEGLGNRARDLRGEARKKEQEAWDEAEAAERKRAESAALAAHDRRIEREIEALEGPMAEILRRIAELKGALAGKGDPAQIAQAVAETQKAADDCKADCEKKRAEQKQLEKEIADLEKEMEQIAKDVEALFLSDGWTGKATFDKASGRVRWGFVRDGGGGEIGNNTNPKTQQVEALRKQKNQKAKELKKKKEDLERAKEDEKNCEKHCEEMQKKADDAKKAQEQSNEQAAQEAKAKALQEKLRDQLAKLAEYLKNHPEIDKGLQKELEDLIKEVPFDPQKWEDFLKRVKEALARKKAAEDKAAEEAKAHDAKAEEAAAEAERKRQEAAANDAAAAEAERAARDAEAEARRQEAKAAEDARKAQKDAEARAAQEAEDCMKKFLEWIQDNIDKGILDEDAKNKLVKWLEDNADKLQGLAEILGNGAGSTLGGLAKGKSGGAAGASALAEGLLQLGAAIFYWWAEAELKDACARLGKKIDERTKQMIALELQGKKDKCGVIRPMRDQSQSWFYFRKGNKILLFKISRNGGLECMGEISG